MKVCPLMMAAGIIKFGSEEGHISCREQKCAWWVVTNQDYGVGQCAIKHIAEAMQEEEVSHV